MKRDNQAVRYEPELSTEGLAQEQSPEGVGHLLAQARIELGYELSGVAAELRIRLPYLQAIEKGRYQDLPGMPYAIGFVRSYAELVGLDPEATVALFKTEVRDLASAQQNLSFPAPKPEGRVPGGALVLISLLVVALAYGGWYLWNDSGRPFVELLPSLGEEEAVQLAEAPAEQAAQPQSAAEAPAEEAAPPEEEEVAAPPVEEPRVEPAADPSRVETAGVIETEAEQGEPAAAVAEPEQFGTGQSETGPLANAATPAPPQPAEDLAAEDLPAEDLPAEEPAAEESMAEDAAAEAPTGEPAEEQVATAPAPPAEQVPDPIPLGSGQIYGDEGAGVRVVLIATADSWVQVRGRDDELLFTRVLRPGDSYRVPNQAGLTLLTGNAGGLDVVIDGQRLPTLGPQGAVRRNVPLDAEALRSVLN